MNEHKRLRGHRIAARRGDHGTLDLRHCVKRSRIIALEREAQTAANSNDFKAAYRNMEKVVGGRNPFDVLIRHVNRKLKK